MSQQSVEQRIKELEGRVQYLEFFVLNSLVHRLYDLSVIVDQSMSHSPDNDEAINHIRHVMEKALLAGWKDDGP